MVAKNKKNINIQFKQTQCTVDIANPSVGSRLSVTLMHHGQRVELFGNISAPSNNLVSLAVCVKLVRNKNLAIANKSRVSCAHNTSRASIIS